VSRVTQDTTEIINLYVYETFTLYGVTFQTLPLLINYLCCGPTTPIMPKHHWFGLIPVRSPLLGESLLFSFPPVT
jgi:hypothetical protein